MPFYTAAIERISGRFDDTYRAADDVRKLGDEATVSAVRPAEGRFSIFLPEESESIGEIRRVLRRHGFRLLGPGPR